jgi:hypothetical protein
MNIIEIIAEKRIKESIDRGEFENLCGTGRPVDLSAYFKTPPNLRIVYTLMKNSGLEPGELKVIQISGKDKCTSDPATDNPSSI